MVDAEVSMQGTRTIIVADDDPSIRKVIQRWFYKMPYHILEARNGMEAKKLFEDHPQVQVVISDMSMGLEEESGLALFQAIRADVVKRRGIFIAMSADFSQFGMTQVIRTEARDPTSPLRVVHKPNFIIELMEHVRKWET